MYGYVVQVKLDRRYLGVFQVTFQTDSTSLYSDFGHGGAADQPADDR